MGSLAACAGHAHAQQPRKILRVVAASGQPRSSVLWLSFLERMTRLGYEEGRNFSFDHVLVDSADAYPEAYRRFGVGAADIIIAPGPEFSLRAALDVVANRQEYVTREFVIKQAIPAMEKYEANRYVGGLCGK